MKPEEGVPVKSTRDEEGSIGITAQIATDWPSRVLNSKHRAKMRRRTKRKMLEWSFKIGVSGKGKYWSYPYVHSKEDAAGP